MSTNNIYNSVVLLRANEVVPFAMKRSGSQVDSIEFFVGHLPSYGVHPTIQPTGDGQPLGCRRARDQAHDGLIIPKGLSPPVRGDERKQPVFHLVPFAGPGRKMANQDRQPRCVCQLLQTHLPQPQATPVAAAVISNRRAFGYSRFPSTRHHPRIEATAKAPVS